MCIRVGASVVGLMLYLGVATGEEAKLAPVNPYNGRQMREEVFEFTQKPTVRKEGEKWVITFASKGNCDATVSILEKEGKIIRPEERTITIGHTPAKDRAWRWVQMPSGRSGLVDCRTDEPLEDRVAVARKWNAWADERLR